MLFVEGLESQGDILFHLGLVLILAILGKNGLFEIFVDSIDVLSPVHVAVYIVLLNLFYTFFWSFVIILYPH